SSDWIPVGNLKTYSNAPRVPDWPSSRENRLTGAGRPRHAAKNAMCLCEPCLRAIFLVVDVCPRSPKRGRAVRMTPREDWREWRLTDCTGLTTIRARTDVRTRSAGDADPVRAGRHRRARARGVQP